MYKLLSNITSFLNRFGRDRYYHFIFALLLTQILIGGLAILGCGSSSIIIGPSVTICLGFLKEFMDQKNGGEFEPYDVVWDFLGCFAGLVLVILVLAGF